MPRRKRYPSPEEATRVSLQDIAVCIDRTEHQTRKLLGKLGFIEETMRRGKIGRQPYYEAVVIDILNALLGRPHRELSPRDADWLSRYLEGTHDAPRVPSRPRATGPQGPDPARPDT